MEPSLGTTGQDENMITRMEKGEIQKVFLKKLKILLTVFFWGGAGSRMKS